MTQRCFSTMASDHMKPQSNDGLKMANKCLTNSPSPMVADTGIFIEHLRAKDKLSTTLYKIADGSEIYISAVTLYELHMVVRSPI